MSYGVGETLYERAQMGWLTFVITGLVLFSLSIVTGGGWVLWLSSVLALVVLVVFSLLRVRVTRDELKWSFGPGVPRWSLQIADIASYEAVTYPWWYGYGIRLTPEGWLYNVSGKHAVRILTTGGKVLRIGTDDPTGLIDALGKVKAAAERQKR